MKKKKIQFNLTTTWIIMMGFVAGILLGTILLELPFSVTKGTHLSVMDAFFTAVTSICVTGLSTVSIGTTFSFFGQFVILLLIQIGGLGVVTFTVLVLISMGKRISISERLLLMNAYNMDSLKGLVRMTRKIVFVSFCIEGIGAILYMPFFIKDFGLKGIWFSLFHAVSAYCNAGIDLLGENSICRYVFHPGVNIITMMLIIAGGLGFPVFWEIERWIQERRNHVEYRKKLALHAKIVFTSTGILILAGMLITLFFEWNNPETIGLMPMGKKILTSLFQSVTLRTAGFATIDQASFSPASCVAYMVMMLIGGSPAGTAGGIKTVTFVVMMLAVYSNIRGDAQVTAFHRTITDEFVKRCTAIACFSITVWLILASLLLYVQQCDFLDALYESVSAIATVGLSRGLTSQLNSAGKVIIMIAMYLGRIGPITLALAFNYRRKRTVENAESRIIIG